MRCSLHHLADVLRQTGIEVEEEFVEEFKDRLTWVAPDGTEMEAFEFIEEEGNRNPDLYVHCEAARAIKPVGTGLDGFWTRVQRRWGCYRYPAGKDPRETGIQFQIDWRGEGLYTETVPLPPTETEQAIAFRLHNSQN